MWDLRPGIGFQGNERARPPQPQVPSLRYPVDRQVVVRQVSQLGTVGT